MNGLKAFYHVAKIIANGREIVEVCDFGDSYGFIMQTDNIFANQYFCADKKTYKPFTFIPSQDLEKYRKRTIIPLETLEGDETQ